MLAGIGVPRRAQRVAAFLAVLRARRRDAVTVGVRALQRRAMLGLARPLDTRRLRHLIRGNLAWREGGGYRADLGPEHILSIDGVPQTYYAGHRVEHFHERLQ